MSKQPCFHLIATGGTIDSYYDPDQCTVLCFEQSVLPEHLSKHAGVPAGNVRFSQLCMKDSRTINDDDRAEMAVAISDSEEHAIVLTHGSFTVFETARYLAEQHMRFIDKTVVLTGALRPIDGFTYSDGLFNLGAAALAAQCASAGVYVCIEGRLFQPDERELWH